MTKKRIIVLLLAALFLFLAMRLYYFLTDDFRLSNINYELPHNPEWDFAFSDSEKNKLSEILNQKFTYIGKGAQVYAFASADDQWVIKFFKFKHLKPSLFVTALPPIGPLARFKAYSVQNKTRKRDGLFAGYRAAFLYDRANAGLFFLHFNRSSDLNLKVTLVDKLGLERTIPLDPLVFVVQKKGKTLRTVLSDHLEKGEVALAQEKTHLILNMYLSEYQNGIWDRDHGVTHNTGFIADTPLHLDVGKISFDLAMRDKSLYRSDLAHVGYKIAAWIKDHYPQYYAAMLSSLEEHLSKLLNEEAHVQNRA